VAPQSTFNTLLSFTKPHFISLHRLVTSSLRTASTDYYLDHLYPHNAVFCTILVIALCPTVRLLQVRVASKWLPSTYLTLVCLNLGIAKNAGTSLWNFVPNSLLALYFTWLCITSKLYQSFPSVTVWASFPYVWKYRTTNRE